MGLLDCRYDFRTMEIAAWDATELQNQPCVVGLLHEASVALQGLPKLKLADNKRARGQ
jgi:hypothetical protein